MKPLRVFGGHVVNAGDGWHAHPTQALLDLYTLRDHLPGGDLRGRKIVIVGDILHSRVARSNIWSLTTSGADLWLCGPATLLRGFEPLAAALPDARRLTITTSIDAALDGADAVMALRLQQERMSSGCCRRFASMRRATSSTRRAWPGRRRRPSSSTRGR
jgi:aspartate carbamoyltransferase catalytic subunit